MQGFVAVAAIPVARGDAAQRLTNAAGKHMGLHRSGRCLAGCVRRRMHTACCTRRRTARRRATHLGSRTRCWPRDLQAEQERAEGSAGAAGACGSVVAYNRHVLRCESQVADESQYNTWPLPTVHRIRPRTTQHGHVLCATGPPPMPATAHGTRASSPRCPYDAQQRIAVRLQQSHQPLRSACSSCRQWGGARVRRTARTQLCEAWRALTRSKKRNGSTAPKTCCCSW